MQSITYQICQAQEDVRAQAQYVNVGGLRYRLIQNGIKSIKYIHVIYQHWLQDEADYFHGRADHHDKEVHRCAESSFFGRIESFLFEYEEHSELGDEYRAYAEIFKKEGYIECPDESNNQNQSSNSDAI